MFSTIYWVFKKEIIHFLAGQKSARLAGIFWVVATKTPIQLICYPGISCSAAANGSPRHPMGCEGPLAQDQNKSTPGPPGASGLPVTDSARFV